MEAGPLNKKIGFIIQARMGSSRLPGKILLPIPLDSSTPLVGRIINSLKKSQFVPQIVIATSNDKLNDPLELFCQHNKVNCFRGAEDDVLSRFVKIQKDQNFDVIVRLTGDNPFIDVSLLDKAIIAHIESGVDYTWTDELPLGMNFEIFNANILENLPLNELSNQDREHVTLYFKRSEKYTLHNLQLGLEKKYSGIRLTVDYPSDFLVASLIFSLIEKSGKSELAVIDQIQQRYPWIYEINKENHQRRDYNDIQEELKFAKPILKAFGFKKILEKLQVNE